MAYWLEILPVLLDGFTISVSVYALTMIFALPIGMMIGLIADLFKSLRKLISVFTWIIRGTPLLLQLYVTMYAIPLLFPMRMDRFAAGAITFIINYAAYFAEIFRSGLAIIPKGQWQAAEVLGLSKVQTVWYIILPTMFRNTLLPLINEAITLVKDTSLLAAIALGEMLRNAREIVSKDLRVDALVIAGIIYLLFSLVVVSIGKQFEKKLLVQR
ncbi:MAG: polar amino acid transport system permease protein [Erysipelotrichaceae bacterium]|nr:MAG: polar amino acid transport system permease [Erysipelotrichaceae bacterium]TXT18175.1 MAG: polar amino acid transport system permease protein [Erysipelotrichaceae bacterium]